jgi:hypothetical protein
MKILTINTFCYCGSVLLFALSATAQTVAQVQIR